MVGQCLFLIGGRKILLLQLTPTGAQDSSLAVEAKDVFIVQGPISSVSSAMISSLSYVLFLSYWDARCDSQLFRISIPAGTMHFLVACCAPAADVAGCRSTVRSSCLVPVHSLSSSPSVVGLVCTAADGRVTLHQLSSMQADHYQCGSSSNVEYSLTALSSFELHDGIRQVTLWSSDAMLGAIIEGMGTEHYMVSFHIQAGGQLRWRCTAMSADGVSLQKAIFAGPRNDRLILGWLESRRDATTHLCFGEVLRQSKQTEGSGASSDSRIVFRGIVRSVQLFGARRHPAVLTLLDATKVPILDRLVAGMPRIMQGTIALHDVRSFDCLWQQSIACAIADPRAFLTILAGPHVPPRYRAFEELDRSLCFSWIYVDTRGSGGTSQSSIVVHSTTISLGSDAFGTASLRSAGLCVVGLHSDQVRTDDNGDNFGLANEQALMTDADRQVEIEEQHKYLDNRTVSSRHLYSRRMSVDCLVLITPEAPSCSIVLIGWEADPSSNALLELGERLPVAHDGAVIDVSVVLDTQLVLSVSFFGLLIYAFVPAGPSNRGPFLEVS